VHCTNHQWREIQKSLSGLAETRIGCTGRSIGSRSQIILKTAQESGIGDENKLRTKEESVFAISGRTGTEMICEHENGRATAGTGTTREEDPVSGIARPTKKGGTKAGNEIGEPDNGLVRSS
jgi:hypothetical protein